MLPLLKLPIGMQAPSSDEDDDEPKQSRKRRASSPPQNWTFFALPWGEDRQYGALPVLGLEVFDSNQEQLLFEAKRFTDNSHDGCGAPNIAEGLSEELGLAKGFLASEHVMLLTGLYDVTTDRIVALLTVSIGGSDGDLDRLVTGLEERYKEGAWFTEQGTQTPLVTPSEKQLGGVLGYSERLNLYIEHFCTAGSATRLVNRVFGAGRSAMQQTIAYLQAHVAQHVVQSYKRASMREPKKARLATDEWIVAMLRRDLWLHLYSVPNAVEFYKKQGFENIPKVVQREHDPTYLVRDNRMWRPLLP